MNKFLSFLICLFMILCTVGCAKNQKSYEEQKALYDDIIAQYTALLFAKHDGEELSSPNTENMSAQEAAIAEALFGIVDACADEKAAEILGYGYKDIDGNGTPELILLNKYNRLRAIFTISDGAPILLEANYDMGSSFGFVSKNRILLLRRSVTDHIEEGIVYMCRVDGDKMVYDYACGKVYDQEKRETLETFKIEDGERIPIDEDTFRALNREYQKYSVPITGDGDIHKLAAPRIIYPLDSSTSDVNLPVADFSDYAAIRKTYLAISDCLEQFKRSEWEAGKYDNLFSFPDDRSFEYYSHLLYIAYVGIKNMGYDEIDLNGDGQDELVLMNGDYRIKAIFTQKDGVPVLLDAFVFPYHTCWLDDEGLIHVDFEGHDELKYSLYEFTKNGEYNLLYSIIADNYGRYLTKDGKIEPITFERSLELYYDGYVLYNEPFDANEHTRNSSKLTYTPLTEEEDALNASIDKIWRKRADLEKTTGKDFARSNTYVTFENVTDTQAAISLKYVFTLSTPDQNRVLIDESTESTLKINARNENGAFVFGENGIKGKIEFTHSHLWLVIDESSDERFPVGNHCYEKFSPEDLIS